MGRALGAGMHAILFGLKRAYWSSIKKSRRPLHEHHPGLTAARFDLMRVVQMHHPHPIKECRRPAALGVCGPVVRRMVKSLVALGLVTRVRNPFDRRTYDVALTEAGAELIDFAYHRIVRSVRARRWVHQALLGMEKWPDMGLAFEAVEGLEHWLRRLRKAWKAGGWLYYRWHPDD